MAAESSIARQKQAVYRHPLFIFEGAAVLRKVFQLARDCTHAIYYHGIFNQAYEWLCLLPDVLGRKLEWVWICVPAGVCTWENNLVQRF